MKRLILLHVVLPIRGMFASEHAKGIAKELLQGAVTSLDGHALTRAQRFCLPHFTDKVTFSVNVSRDECGGEAYAVYIYKAGQKVSRLFKPRDEALIGLAFDLRASNVKHLKNKAKELSNEQELNRLFGR